MTEYKTIRYDVIYVVKDMVNELNKPAEKSYTGPTIVIVTPERKKTEKEIEIQKTIAEFYDKK